MINSTLSKKYSSPESKTLNTKLNGDLTTIPKMDLTNESDKFMSSVPSKTAPSAHSLNRSSASLLKTQSIFNSSVKLQNGAMEPGLKR